jgi:hypothetical protein
MTELAGKPASSSGFRRLIGSIGPSGNDGKILAETKPSSPAYEHACCDGLEYAWYRTFNAVKRLSERAANCYHA